MRLSERLRRTKNEIAGVMSGWRRGWAAAFAVVLFVLLSCGATNGERPIDPVKLEPEIATKITNDSALRAVGRLRAAGHRERVEALRELREIAKIDTTLDERGRSRAAREVEKAVREERGADSEVDQIRFESAKTLGVVGDLESVPLLEAIRDDTPRYWIMAAGVEGHSEPRPRYMLRYEAQSAIREVLRREERRKLLIEIEDMSDTDAIEFLVEEAYFIKHKMDGLYDYRSQAAGTLLFVDYIDRSIPFVNRHLLEMDPEKKEMLQRVYRYFHGENIKADPHIEEGLRLLGEEQ